MQAQCTFRPDLTKPRVQGMESPAAISKRIIRRGTSKSPEEARAEKRLRLKVNIAGNH